MPELPEVETIVRDLHGHLHGKIVKAVKISNLKSINLSLPSWRKAIVGAKINRVWRRGKQLVFDLNNKKFLVIHLKMTGQLIWQKGKQMVVGGHPITGVGEELPNKFTRVEFDFGNGSVLYFNDVRKFGWLKVLTQDQLDKEFGRLGLEPLAKKFTGVKLQEVLKNKAKSPIKLALLDQARVVGIGNIYADEALFLSKIKPARKVADIKKGEWEILAKAIVQVLKLSIKHRGTSFSDYRDASGSQGNFLKKLKVYGRGGKPCLRDGHILHKTKLGGRGTVFCDYCQK